MFGHKRVPSREGGVEVVVTELANELEDRGHHVTCYNRAGRKPSGLNNNTSTLHLYPGVTTKEVWTINVRGLAAMTSSLSAALCSALGKYDVVHIHAEGPAAMCWIPKLLGKRVVVTIHGLDWKRAKWGGFASKYIKWGEKQAAKHADEIIVLSKNVQDYFKTTYNRDTVYIPNGVGKPVIRPAHRIEGIWGLEKDSYVLFVGRIVPEKGIKYLVEAWNEILTDKRLVIVGDSSDTDDYVKEVKSLAGDNVLFAGFQDGPVLEELFSNAYIYVLPSDVEGMSLSLLEAMSYGNCCLVSDIPECAEITQDNAVVFRASDEVDLNSKLQILLTNPEEVDRLKKATSEYIYKRFNWDDVVEKTLEIYGR